MRRVLRLSFASLLMLITPVLLYLAAALVGGLIPSSSRVTIAEGHGMQPQVYLTANALHADIAIPINSFSLNQFKFLRSAGFPLDNPNLKYLVIGWGSEAFYTSTKEYSDIELSTVWKAATGDASVIHIAPAGDISAVEDAVPVPMSEASFVRLTEFIVSQFEHVNEQPSLVEGVTFGYGDVFYHAKGHFDLLNPCNVWISKALSHAGIGAGIWTPTTYSLMISQSVHN